MQRLGQLGQAAKAVAGVHVQAEGRRSAQHRKPRQAHLGARDGQAAVVQRLGQLGQAAKAVAGVHVQLDARGEAALDGRLHHGHQLLCLGLLPHCSSRGAVSSCPVRLRVLAVLCGSPARLFSTGQAGKAQGWVALTATSFCALVSSHTRAAGAPSAHKMGAGCAVCSLAQMVVRRMRGKAQREGLGHNMRT